MHCANLVDALVKGATPLQQSPQQTTLATAKSVIETKEEEDSRMLRMVLDIGILVLEGRLPERTSKRGYIEGPHCVLYPNTQAHRCDFSNYMCKRAEKYSQLMQSIWNECKGLCIELRVCADCSCGEEQVWKNTISRFDYVLEQWYIETTSVRNEEEDLGVMNWYGLLQAIRSQIHFSQLSAWWSSNRAQLPKNITYHVLPITQTDVNSCALQHKFPVLAFSTTYLQVKVRSQPRSEVLPKIHCPVHSNQDNVVDDRMMIHCDRLGKHHCQALVDLDENENEPLYEVDQFWDRIFITGGSDDTVSHGPVHPVRKARTRSRDAVTDCSLKSRRNECCRTDPRFLTFQRNVSDLSSRPFHVSSSKNVLSSTSSSQVSQPASEGRSKPRINAVSSSDGHSINTNSLAHETTTQLLNICNWTNSMVSNVVSRVRSGASLMSNLPEPNMLAELFRLPDEQIKSCESPSVLSSSSSQSNGCSSCNRVRRVEENGRSSDMVVANGVHKPLVEVTNIETKDRNSNHEPNSDLLLIKTTVTATDAGDRCSKISQNKHRSKNFTFESAYSTNVMETYLEEKKQLKVPSKPINGVAQDRKFEKLKNVTEKRFPLTKPKKRMLPLAGNVIESVFSGRVYFSQAIENFKMRITTGGSSSNGQNNGTELQAASYYYHFGDGDLSKSYLVKSFIPDHEKGLQIPTSGQLQVSVSNTEGLLIKVFVVPYDLSDMPRCTKTFIRHKNYYTPTDTTDQSIQWLQSFLQLKCLSSKSGRLYLQDEISAIIFQKSDLNTACELQQTDLKHHDVTEVAYKFDGQRKISPVV